MTAFIDKDICKKLIRFYNLKTETHNKIVTL